MILMMKNQNHRSYDDTNDELLKYLKIMILNFLLLKVMSNDAKDKLDLYQYFHSKKNQQQNIAIKFTMNHFLQNKDVIIDQHKILICHCFMELIDNAVISILFKCHISIFYRKNDIKNCSNEIMLCITLYATYRHKILKKRNVYQ